MSISCSYVVSSSLWSSTGSMGFGFKIQSLKAPSFLEQRVEAFIVSHRDKLVATPSGVFQASKDALVVKLLEAPKNMSEETSRFWYQVERGYNDFLRSMFHSMRLPSATVKLGGCLRVLS